MAIAILDFGSQYAQLIARRVREAQVYCELYPWDAPAGQVMALAPDGFILSGGPASVYEAGAPVVPAYVLESRRPVLAFSQHQERSGGCRVCQPGMGTHGGSWGARAPRGCAAAGDRRTTNPRRRRPS